MSIGNKIATARKAKNLTQEQLAQLMSVTRQSISRWESEQSYPEMEKISFLAQVLGVSCDYLLNDNQQEPNVQMSISTPSSGITRLLYAAKGKPVKLTFYEDITDFDLMDKTCIITDFDGQWMNVTYTKKKTSHSKLIPLSSLLSIQFVKEEK